MDCLRAGLSMVWRDRHGSARALLLQQAVPDAHHAGISDHHVLSMARSRYAPSRERCAVTNLARRWQQLDTLTDACDLLAPVANGFTEGFGTVDLKEAHALLNELSEGSS